MDRRSVFVSIVSVDLEATSDEPIVVVHKEVLILSIQVVEGFIHVNLLHSIFVSRRKDASSEEESAENHGKLVDRLSKDVLGHFLRSQNKLKVELTLETMEELGGKGGL